MDYVADLLRLPHKPIEAIHLATRDAGFSKIPMMPEFRSSRAKAASKRRSQRLKHFFGGYRRVGDRLGRWPAWQNAPGNP
jgi:hypothetical protein